MRIRKTSSRRLGQPLVFALMVVGLFLVALLWLFVSVTATGETPTPFHPIPPEAFLSPWPPRTPPSATIAPTVAPIPTPKPTVRLRASVSHLLVGVHGSWYCLSGVSRCTRNHPDGLYAAISPDLAYLRGRTITVLYGSRSVRVTVIDCNCQATYAIDLYASAYERLAPLSSGRITVSLRW